MNILFIALGLISFSGPSFVMEISDYNETKALSMSIKLILVVSFCLSMLYFVATYQPPEAVESSSNEIINSVAHVTATIDAISKHFKGTINKTLFNFIFNTLFGLLGTSSYFVVKKLFISKN